jgi:hypothetical protein
MTLIIASAAPEAQIMVADRLISDIRSGKEYEKEDWKEPYKLFQYVNPQQDYVFSVGFTGLAQLGRIKTVDWLMETLPKTMGTETEIGMGASAFAGECARVFAGLRDIPESYKATTFVFCGRFNTFGMFKGQPEDPCPFVAVITNCADASARQVNTVSSTFSVFKWSRPHSNPRTRPTTTICRGDLCAANIYAKEFRRLVRLLKRDIPYQAKVKLSVDYIRLVSRSSNSINNEILSLSLLRSGHSEGGEWPVDVGKLTRTMPHLVMANGNRITNFAVHCNEGFV